MESKYKSERKQPITIPMMLQKLDDMYKRENEIILQSRKLKAEWELLKNDMAVMEQLIIRQRNINAQQTNVGGLNE